MTQHTSTVNQKKQTTLTRAIGRWSLTALVLNCIIGSGIFGLPSVVAAMVGRASPIAYLFAAVVIGVVMACFAEVAAQFRDAGGPYLYAHAAFGRFVGIEVGWLTWLVRLTSTAANANLLVSYLAEFWPQAQMFLPRLMVLTLFVGLLAAINYRGVKAGTQVSNFFTLTKLLSLSGFVALGLFFLLHNGAVSAATPTAVRTGNWFDAVLVLTFSFGGFETAVIPMGEAKEPARDAPFALFAALAGVTTIYTLIQVVVVGVIPNTAVTDRPIAVAAQRMLGPAGAEVMAVAALISIYGFFTAAMLAVPRLTFAMAERGDFPRFFGAIHRKFHTPHVSIVVFAALTWLLAAMGSFRGNVTLSAVARMFIYGAVCAALPALRRKNPEATALRLPAGRLLAALGVSFSVLLLTRMGLRDLVIIAATSAIALANWLVVRRRTRAAYAAVKT